MAEERLRVDLTSSPTPSANGRFLRAADVVNRRKAAVRDYRPDNNRGQGRVVVADILRLMAELPPPVTSTA